MNNIQTYSAQLSTCYKARTQSSQSIKHCFALALWALWIHSASATF